MPAVIPLVIGLAVSAGIVGVYGISYLGIALAIGSIVSTVASLAMGAITSKPKAARPTPTGQAEDRKQLIRGSVEPRQVIYGYARVGGAIVYAASSGSDKRFLHLVVVLATHRCNNIRVVWINGTSIYQTELDGAGNLTNAANPMVGRVRIEKFLGDQTSGSATLAAESPDGWSTTHALRECTYLYIRLEYDREKMSGLQSIEAEVEGKNTIYDPRSTTTGFTSNWALCVLDYLRSPYGLGCADSEIDFASFNTAANLSDESVTINAGGTTQNRYLCDGSFKLDRAPLDIMESLLSAGAGTLCYVAGQYRLYGGAYTAPTASIGISDFAGEVEVVPRAARRELFNGVRGTFLDPERGFQPSEFGAVFDTTFDAQDGGERVWRDIDFAFTANNIRAQRLARMILLRARQSLRIKAPVKYSSLRFCVWQMVSVTHPDLGLDAKPMRVIGWEYEPNTGRVMVELQAEAATAYAWLYEYATTLPTPPDTTLINPLSLPTPGAPTLTPSTSLQTDGAIIPSIVVTWTPVAHAFVTAMEVHWRLSGATAWQREVRPVGDARCDLFPLTAGATYEVRLAAVSTLSRSALSGISTAVAAADTTVPAVPTGLTATPTVGGTMLRWNMVGDLDLDRYQVFERPNTSAAFVQIGETYSCDFAREISAGTSQRYSVRSVDQSGNASARSAEVVATPGVVAAAQLGVGTGNMIWNSCFTGDTRGWILQGNTPSQSLALASASFTLRGVGTGVLSAPGTMTAAMFMTASWAPSGGYPSCVPGRRYQGSALAQGHRCIARLDMLFYDAAFGFLDGFSSNNHSAGGSGGIEESQYTPLSVLGTAPAGAVQVEFRAFAGGNGGAAPAAYFTKTMFGEVPANATEVGNWVPGGPTQISGGQLLPLSVSGAAVQTDAITTHVSATATASLTGNGSEQAAVSMTFTLAEARVGTLLVSMQHGYTARVSHTVTVRLNGTVIFSRSALEIADYPNFMEPLSLAAGTHTIALGWTGASGQIFLNRRSIIAFLRAK